MDDYGLGKTELNGSLISMEFGPGGRIQQLWVVDPTAPEDSEEFQFVASPVPMGEEFVEDYFPGTILIGARTSPDDPWIVSRNARADQMGDEDDPSTVGFRYEFSFLEELEATGRFYELPGRIPQIVWELTIRNRSRRSVEIGELGFPLALNNVLEGFSRDDHGTREMFHERTHVHKFIGSCASFVHAQRMHGLQPGLLIYPGGDTRWEFVNHVPASLNTPYQWEGVPVVYVHSRAAIEREEWPEWIYGHTSTILEPQETRRYEMRFAPMERMNAESIVGSLASLGRPAISLFPGAVAPHNVGISVEVSGATPTRFWTEPPIEFETDADEDGGYCFVRPTKPGTVHVGFEDVAGRTSETQILFTEPISDLIHARAKWIVQHQIAQGDVAGAIVPADNETGDAASDIREFITATPIYCGLGDALFLAEKNVAFPESDQIEALDHYLEAFFESRIRNPGDGSVASMLPSRTGVGAGFAFAEMYPATALLYASMGSISANGQQTGRTEFEYLQRSAETALALWHHAIRDPILRIPISLMSYMPALFDRYERIGLVDDAKQLRSLLDERWEGLASMKYPFASVGIWNPDGFEECLAAARHTGNLALKERILRCLLAGKSQSPCWWWYACDKDWSSESDFIEAANDCGELCLGQSTTSSSAALFSLFARDYAFLPPSVVRMAFGGMLSVWALVREDGAAGMGFCPDPASSRFGMSRTTGDIGFSLYHYIRSAGAYLLPGAGLGLTTFGCSFSVQEGRGEETYVVRPWDGIGRKIVARQIGIEVLASGGQIEELRFDGTKRKATITLHNQSHKELLVDLSVLGLWGKHCLVSGMRYRAERGRFTIPARVPAQGKSLVEIEVCE